MPHFEIIWLDESRKPLDLYYIEKLTSHAALRSVALRVTQSQHLVPKNAAGFVVVPKDLEVPTK